MTEYILILCLGVLLACIVSRSKIIKRIEEFKMELAELQTEERVVAGQRRQAEGILLTMEMQEREVKQANKKLKQQVDEVQRWIEEFRALAAMGMMGSTADMEAES